VSITAGTLVLGSSTALSASAVTVAGGTLDLGQQTVANALTLNAGAILNGTLDLSQLTANAGLVGANLTGTGGFTRNGSGVLTLAGTNTFTGGVTVTTGTLAAGSASAFGANLVTVNGGTVNLGQQALGNSFVLNGGSIVNGTLALGKVTANAGNLGANLTGTTGFTKTGNAILTLSGANTYTGATVVNAGTLVAGSATAFAATNVTINGGILDLGGLTIANAVNVAGGELTGGTIAVSQVTPTSGKVSATLAGTGSLTKSGNSVFTLSGANTYQGGTTVAAGTLVATNAAAFGTGVVTVTGGTLDLGSLAIANNLTLQGGALTNAAAFAGLATVPATKVFTLNTDLGGTLNVLGTVDFVSGSYAGLTGTGLVKRSTPGLTLSSPTAFAGTFKVLAGGVVSITNAGALGTGTIAIAGGTVDLNGLSLTNTITLAGGGSILNSAADLVISLANGSYTAADLATGVRIGVTSTALLDLTGVTNDIVFMGGTMFNLDQYAGNLTVASGTLTMPSTLNLASLTLTGGVTDPTASPPRSRSP
jgi:autotransporter-associated beta strand protein